MYSYVTFQTNLATRRTTSPAETLRLQLLMPVIYVTAVEIKVLKQNNPLGTRGMGNR
jgi:hypothetical protein